MLAQAASQLSHPHALTHDVVATPPAFEGTLPYTDCCYRAGEEIYALGDRASALYQVEFGAVRIFRLLADGRRQISAFHFVGDVFGFEAGDRHNFFAEAICATGIRAYRRPVEPELAREILPVALEALVRAQDHLLIIGRQNADERVAAFLLDLMERQDGLTRIELPMSRADIGDYLGLTIETVSRVLSRFRQKGHVHFKRARNAEIVHPDALRAICE